MSQKDDKKRSIIFITTFVLFLISFTVMIVLGIITTTTEVSDSVMTLYLNVSVLVFVLIFISICLGMIYLQIIGIRRVRGTLPDKSKRNNNNNIDDICFKYNLVKSKAVFDCEKYNKEKNIKKNTFDKEYIIFVELLRINIENQDNLATIIKYKSANKKVAKDFISQQQVYGTDIVSVSTPEGGYTKDVHKINEF